MVVPRMVVSPAMVVGRFKVVHIVVVGMLTIAQLALHARAADRAQHGSGHHTPDGKQYGKQQQEPDSDGLHRSPKRRRQAPEQPGGSASWFIVNLVTVTRSSG